MKYKFNCKRCGYSENVLYPRKDQDGNLYIICKNCIKRLSNAPIEEKRKAYIYDFALIPNKGKSKFMPTKNNCTVPINPEYETEKAYAIVIGESGLWTNPQTYYEYIPKSICYVDKEGQIYAPHWAIPKVSRV